MDSVAGQGYDAISEAGMAFSPDGKHMAYAARRGKDWFVVLDGLEQERLEKVIGASLRFSADGAHLAYIAGKGRDSFENFNRRVIKCVVAIAFKQDDADASRAIGHDHGDHC